MGGATEPVGSDSKKKPASRGKNQVEKAPRADRSKRLLDLVMLLLRARAPVTFREIRDQFTSYQTRNVEAGLRAFERDKADLLELGVPIRYITPDEDDAIDEGGYLIDLKRFRLPEMHLTKAEVSALLLAAAVARAVPGVSYARVVDLAVKKLAFDAPELPDTPTEFLPASQASTIPPVLVHFPQTQGRENPLGDRFSRLEAATRYRKRVTLQYQSGSTGYKQSRDVDPYGLIYRESNWVLVGYCHLRKDVRSFRLDRILEMKVAPKPKSPDFQRPDDFDARSYANRSPWTFQTEELELVCLEIGQAAAHIAREDFGPAVAIESLPKDCVSVRFPCGNPDYTVTRILSAKGAIKVLEGLNLKKRLKDGLASIKENFS